MIFMKVLTFNFAGQLGVPYCNGKSVATADSRQFIQYKSIVYAVYRINHCHGHSNNDSTDDNKLPLNLIDNNKTNQ